MQGVGFVMAAVLFGTAAGVISLAWNDRFGQETIQTDGAQNMVSAEEGNGQESAVLQYTAAGSVEQVVQNAMPSIVAITGVSVQEIPDFWGYGSRQYESESSGSGIVIAQTDTQLLIATNDHVVENQNTLSVVFTNQDGSAAQEGWSDGAVPARIRGTSPENDLAVISVDLADIPESIRPNIRVAAIDDSDALQVGTQVVAIGNALGYGQSATSGYVSALNQQVASDTGIGTYIQTDAAINPGNSGGALLNMKGELIGINVSKSSGNAVEGMGYAIPIAKAEPVLDSLMSRETRFKVDESQAAYIGVTCMNVDSSVTEMYGIPEGAFVESVEAGGPAEQAGIQASDVITKFDGIQITGSQELVDRLEYYEAGETVDVVYSRAENGEYQEHTVSVTLGRRSEMTQEDPAEARQ